MNSQRNQCSPVPHRSNGVSAHPQGNKHQNQESPATNGQEGAKRRHGQECGKGDDTAFYRTSGTLIVDSLLPRSDYYEYSRQGRGGQNANSKRDDAPRTLSGALVKDSLQPGAGDYGNYGQGGGGGGRGQTSRDYNSKGDDLPRALRGSPVTDSMQPHAVIYRHYLTQKNNDATKLHEPSKVGQCPGGKPTKDVGPRRKQPAAEGEPNQFYLRHLEVLNRILPTKNKMYQYYLSAQK